MKLLFPTISFIYTASASFTEMEDVFEKIMQNHTAHDRGFAPNQFSLSISVAQNYGCWCYSLQEHTGKGKSKPVDELDALCKRLSEGYDCASIDADAKGEICNAWEEDYSDANGNAIACSKLMTQEEVDALPNLDDTLIAILGIQIVSECKQQACQIEKDFVDKVAELFLNEPNANDDNYKHDNFDQEANCVAKQCVETVSGSCDSDRQCCGDVPGRRTFKTVSQNGNTRECCGDTVYFTSGLTTMDCCTDNITGAQSLASIGSC